jgi:tetratricopeptide (TPR) repeat protein
VCTIPHVVRRLVPSVLVLALLASSCGRDASGSESASELLAAGLAAHRAGQLGKAANDYLGVLAIDPADKLAHYNLGLIDQADGDLLSAQRNYHQVLHADIGFTPALFNLAMVRDGLGDPRGATEYYLKVLAIEPENAAAHLNLGFALKELGEKKLGNDEIARAIELDPALAGQLEPVAADGPVATDEPHT